MNTSLIRATARLAVATALLGALGAQAATISVLFVGNSYTFGRVDPVMGYNAANVHDLTAAMQVANSSGSNPYEPHPWGGVPGIFKQMTVQAGLDYDVSISARNAASLRGQFLNTNAAGWDMLGNIASKKWDSVVLQGLSDEALPNGRGANANNASFSFYANQLERYIHQGNNPTGADTGTVTTTESALWGSLAACRAGTGGSATACNTSRTIKANPNESASTQVFMYQTWARPDMVYAHTNTVTNPSTGAITLSTGSATTYYDDNRTLEAMTTDLHDAYFGLAAANPNIQGVAAVGDAFMRAVQTGVATRDPYASDALTDGKIDLWWDDKLHASKYGSYLSALTMFGTLTGLDPLMLGAAEKAAADLGISSTDALALQRVASAQLGFAVPEPATPALLLLAGVAALGFRRPDRAARQG